MLRARRVTRPAPRSDATDTACADAADRRIDDGPLETVLARLRADGVPGLVDLQPLIHGYRDALEAVDPDTLPTPAALAYWLNIYNAGAIDMAAASHAAGDTSVFRTPGRFTTTWATVAGETLSLDDIEHGKIRRFGDPRVHGALVCGSASCPTLRYEPYRADAINPQLDDQMTSFLAGGGLVVDESDRTVHLSRIFRWYGTDFVHPSRMPTLLPTSKRRILHSVLPWTSAPTRTWVDATDPAIEFQPYDWSLACNVR